MRRKIIGATIFVLFLNLICSVVPTQAYYTGMNPSLVVANSVSTTDVKVVGEKLMVADSTGNRLLIWNKIPTNSTTLPDVVVGQTSLAGTSANQGGAAAANTLSTNNAQGFASDGIRLFIADRFNNRVLVYNQIPTQNNASADVVIGQTTMSGTSAGVTQTTMNAPEGVDYDSKTGKLVVHDNRNARILIYNRVPTTNGAPADVVVGQVDFTHSASNQGGAVSASTIATSGGAPFPGVTTYDGKLLVADRFNNRVLIWNQIPTQNNAPADVVIGQPNFTSNTANQGLSTPQAYTMSFPRGVAVDKKGRLFTIEFAVNRILIFNQIPTTNNASADVVIGQTSFTSTAGPSITGGWNVFVTESQLFTSGSFGGVNGFLIFNDDATAPGLSMSDSPQAVDNGLIKLTGNAFTSVANYTIQNVQYMVNGGGFNGATATDGAFDTANENFFFTFDPKSNGNQEEGYAVQVKSTTSNIDTTDHLFYFKPFNLSSPSDRGFLTTPLPTLSFSVNKQQTQLKQNLSTYRVLVKRSGEDWKTYVDSIPVDYESVKTSDQNLQKSGQSTNGNGTYEDKKMFAVYSNNNSTISVTPKAVDDQGNASSLSFDQNGKLLSNGGYEWKVQAIDRNNHVQETSSRKFVVGASAFSNGSNWFPLQINSITGLGRVYLSTINPQFIKPKYRIQTSNPIFSGIATSGSTVQFDLTNQTCQTTNGSNCVQTFTANANAASQFALSLPANTLKSGTLYSAQFSVSQNGLFNALPPFVISR